MMDEKSLQILEFPQVREIIARFASFSPSRELALNLQPSSDYFQVSSLLKQSAEARRLLQLEPGFSIGGIFDVREKVKMAALGKVLEPEDFLDINQTLSAFRQLRSALRQHIDEVPLLWQIAETVIELHDVEKEINSCISPGGEVLDSASAALGKTRRHLVVAREQLTQRLQAIVNSTKWQKFIQEPIITEREGRYVIPVKIEHRKDIKGIVHDVSNTGVTVFVEPWTAVEMGNTIRELSIEEEREIERILRSLSAKVGAFQAEISRSINLVAEFDLALAKAKYAQKAKAVEALLAVPGEGSENVLRLVAARHPLLGDNAVPMDVEIGRDFSVLVITGPNTGGKTVALKTFGLLSLMTQAGLPVPAAPDTRIPLFDSIFADIGDEQSIEQTLSTFSWHIGNLVRILERVTGHSLVLLDELGTSTDPAEGSALARSILLHFLSRKTLTIATSHFADLKAFVHATPGMQNASLDFDPITLTPRYHLTVGVPGGSNALATASRLGLLPEIVDNARGMLAKASVELEDLLADLAQQKETSQNLQSKLVQEHREWERRNSELETEMQRVKTEERKTVLAARDAMVKEAAELHKEIRAAVAELRKGKTEARIDQAKRILEATRERLKSPVFEVKSDGIIQDDTTIVIGDVVWLRETNLMATVLAVSQENRLVQLQAGQTKLRVSMDSVEKQPKGSVHQPSDYTMVKVEAVKRNVPQQLDLRGKRAEEVEGLIEGYLSDAALARLPSIRIVHGFGTGTVREITRSLLSRHPLVKSFRPGGQGEGGDGATVVSL